MAEVLRVTCTNKTDRTSAHERISHIGGIGFAGRRWKLSHRGAIDAIENGRYSFYVSREDGAARLVIATKDGRKYLKSEADGEQPDNLLSLPECP